MKIHSKFDILFRTLKFFGRLSSTWPPEPGATMQKILLYELCWWLHFLNLTFVAILPLMLGVHYFRKNFDKMAQAASELTVISEAFFNMIICKFQRRRLQMILQKIQNFRKEANDLEKSIIEKYAQRYFNVQAFIGTSFILTGIAFICCPIVTTALIPGDAWYPFSVEPLFTRILIYTLHIFIITQTVICVSIDFTITTLFWFLSMRLELLQKDLRKISTEMDMRNCIRKHQELIGFFDEVSRTVRLLIIKTGFTMAVTVIFAAIQILGHVSLPVIFKFMMLIISASLRLYVTSWAADDLREQSEKVAEAIYQSSWIDKSLKIKKSVRIVIIRSRKPFVISAAGLISEFSLEYYASFLATTLNYFFRARAVIG